MDENLNGVWSVIKRFFSSLFHKNSYSSTMRDAQSRLEHVLQKMGAETYSYDWYQTRTTCTFWLDWVMPDKQHYYYEMPSANSDKSCDDVSELLEAVVSTLEGIEGIAKHGMLDAEALLSSCRVGEGTVSPAQAKLNAHAE